MREDAKIKMIFNFEAHNSTEEASKGSQATNYLLERFDNMYSNKI